MISSISLYKITLWLIAAITSAIISVYVAKYFKTKENKIKITVMLVRDSMIKHDTKLSIDGEKVASFSVYKGKNDRDIKQIEVNRNGKLYYNLESIYTRPHLSSLDDWLNISQQASGFILVYPDQSYVIRAYRIHKSVNEFEDKLELVEESALREHDLPPEDEAAFFDQLEEEFRRERIEEEAR